MTGGRRNRAHQSDGIFEFFPEDRRDHNRSVQFVYHRSGSSGREIFIHPSFIFIERHINGIGIDVLIGKQMVKIVNSCAYWFQFYM